MFVRAITHFELRPDTVVRNLRFYAMEKTHKRSNSLSNKNCQDQLHSIIKLENCVIVVTSTWDTSILKVASEKILRDT